MKEEFKNLDQKINIIVAGDGTSRWGQSTGEFQLTNLTLFGCDLHNKDGGIWELQLFGPNTVWTQYTDRQIEKEVNNKLKSIVSKAIGKKIKKIGWSEQGMQPDKGWSFDVILKGDK